ncbi:MAG: Dam family site-specific DNA-(adenine-N6)-methyltransferase, partial [Nanoarchaeota archaeon]|nr:Dam family site-specific DNA-(adenine-N6)-methyltransferase [Nanoarchaeota archaeon]
KKEPKKLLTSLKNHEKNHAEKHYYETRSQKELEDPIAVASRFIYLNKTCYNGLYRTNSKGEFNVPMGSYTNPTIADVQNIFACNRVLQKATVNYQDFTKIKPKAGDFVYFDPPYHPTDEVSFTKYTKSDFTEKDQTRLRDFALQLHKQGVFVMISNSDTAFIRDIYKHKAFKIDVVDAPRTVNCKAEKRKPIKELLITNYSYEKAGWLTSE